MDREGMIPPRWTAFLRRTGLNGLAAALLEAAGPFTWLAAQVGYGLAPLTGGARSDIERLATALEDPRAIEYIIGELDSEAGAP
jgi:hypothetical protein